jgi:valyl-tRNA synthetase
MVIVLLITQEKLLKDNEKLKDEIIRLNDALNNANYWSKKKDDVIREFNRKINYSGFLSRLKFLITRRL